MVKTNSSKFVLLCILYVRQQSKFGKLVNIAIFSVVKSDLIMLHMHVASYIGWKLFAIDFQWTIKYRYYILNIKSVSDEWLIWSKCHSVTLDVLDQQSFSPWNNSRQGDLKSKWSWFYFSPWWASWFWGEIRLIFDRNQSQISLQRLLGQEGSGGKCIEEFLLNPIATVRTKTFLSETWKESLR